MYGCLKGRTLEELAEVWTSWSAIVRHSEHAVTWVEVKANITGEVMSPLQNRPWKIHQMALMLMESDKQSQRPFFRTSDFDAEGINEFGPPIMVELREMGNIVRQANTGV